MMSSHATIYRYEWRREQPAPAAAWPSNLFDTRLLSAVSHLLPSGGYGGGRRTALHYAIGTDRVIDMDTLMPSRASGMRLLRSARPGISWRQSLGLGLVALALGGVIGPLSTQLRLEAGYRARQTHASVSSFIDKRQTSTNTRLMPPAVPVVFEPLLDSNGKEIVPASEQFSVIVPKVGINAAVTAGVDPSKSEEYQKALKTGVAHAKTSFLPDQNGTVYLFSHSTNYEWFVGELNAVFYLLKNLERGDSIVVVYKGKRYSYKLTEKKVVQPRDTSYLVPEAGRRSLILQTCWPPGSVAERLLLFADFAGEAGNSI